MAGAYFHIPFCKTRCTYCDFYSITDYSQSEKLYNAMISEIKSRKEYFDEALETIYFGGGTPSTFSPEKIGGLLKALAENFRISKDAEVTLEANPDDLDIDYLLAIRQAGVNRLSMGIQSFDDKQLKSINRRHSSRQAVQSVADALEAGFRNISIDLIYGLPGQSFDSWQEQLQRALQLDVQHISAYGLIYEEGTPLWRQMQAGVVKPAEDELMNKMYHYLVDTCKSHGFEQYEIANFSKGDCRSRHNSAYWDDKPYIGIGPAAHSFDRKSRRWNLSSVSEYTRLIELGEDYFETEILSEQDRYNDFVMVSLRKMEGISLRKLQEIFSDKLYSYCLDNARKEIEKKNLEIENNHLRLTPEGVLLSDSVIVSLMHV